MRLEKKHFTRTNKRANWGKPTATEYIDNYSRDLFQKRILDASGFFENLGGKEFNRLGTHVSISSNGLEKSEYTLVD